MHRACDGWHASLVEYRNRTRHSERESGELRCIIQPRKLFDIDPSNFANSINNREKRKRAGIPAGWAKYTSENIEKMNIENIEISFLRRLELLERLSKGAEDTHVPGDRWNVRNHAHDVAHLLADTVEEAGNAPGSIQQAPNFLHEIDHHRLIMLPTRLVRDG